jgi:polysaccharide pyruvyl transferase WcaK-like protein
MKILQGFDFYGAGNIGDDLMMSGFLEGLNQIKTNNIQVTSLCGYNILSQQNRFPTINWVKTQNEQMPFDIWIGMGGTPIQLTSGQWILEYLETLMPLVLPFKQKYLINIGVEKEALKLKDRFIPFLKLMDKISTRDEESASLLMHGFGIDTSKIIVASDLANISLSQLKSKVNTTLPKYDIGLMIGAELLSPIEYKYLIDFTFNSPLANSLVFLANEVRENKNFESAIYKQTTKWHWLKSRKKPDLLIPSYQNGTLLSLIEPISNCKTVVSTRFHGILAAAWLGCKVVGLGSRSKVKILCDDLGIPYFNLPLKKNSLEEIVQSAVTVPTERLLEMKDKAIKGMEFIVNQDNK